MGTRDGRRSIASGTPRENESRDVRDASRFESGPGLRREKWTRKHNKN
jgi:hypothetical protein